MLPCAQVYFTIFAGVVILVQSLSCAAVVLDIVSSSSDQCSPTCQTLSVFANRLPQTK